MGIKQKLKKMNQNDLIFICKEMSIKCSINDTKSNLISKLISPLKRKYKMNQPLLSSEERKNYEELPIKEATKIANWYNTKAYTRTFNPISDFDFWSNNKLPGVLKSISKDKLDKFIKPILKSSLANDIKIQVLANTLKNHVY